jgi:hypothetical protein
MSVVGLVATAKSFQIFGRIYHFASARISLVRWIAGSLFRVPFAWCFRSRPIPDGAMAPVSGRGFAVHLRPETAEVSLRHISVGERGVDRQI